MVSLKKIMAACKKKKKIFLVGIHRGPGTQPHLYHVNYLPLYVISL